MTDKSTAAIIYKTIENLEVLYGSFEIEENVIHARKECCKTPSSILMFDIAVDAYLKSYSPEETEERKRLANMIPVGIIHA